MTGDWNILEYDRQDVEDIAAFTSLDPAVCLQRLRDYDLNEMAKEWRRVNPITPDEVRRFYESTELYIWELTKWHNSEDYTYYLELIETLIERCPPARFPKVLDYGAGIGTVALRLIKAGYKVTLADVPGKTLSYAEFRLHRQGVDFEVVRIMDELPKLRHTYDILVTFDVLEHIPRPDRVIRMLSAALRSGGAAAIIAGFLTTDTHPHHLLENSTKIAPVWPLTLRLNGLDPVGKDLYRKAHWRQVFLRRLRFRVWQATGLYVFHNRDIQYLQRIVC